MGISNTVQPGDGYFSSLKKRLQALEGLVHGMQNEVDSNFLNILQQTNLQGVTNIDNATIAQAAITDMVANNANIDNAIISQLNAQTINLDNVSIREDSGAPSRPIVVGEVTDQTGPGFMTVRCLNEGMRFEAFIYFAGHTDPNNGSSEIGNDTPNNGAFSALYWQENLQLISAIQLYNTQDGRTLIAIAANDNLASAQLMGYYYNIQPVTTDVAVATQECTQYVETTYNSGFCASNLETWNLRAEIINADKGFFNDLVTARGMGITEKSLPMQFFDTNTKIAVCRLNQRPTDTDPYFPGYFLLCGRGPANPSDGVSNGTFEIWVEWTATNFVALTRCDDEASGNKIIRSIEIYENAGESYLAIEFGDTLPTSIGAWSIGCSPLDGEGTGITNPFAIPSTWSPLGQTAITADGFYPLVLTLEVINATTGNFENINATNATITNMIVDKYVFTPKVFHVFATGTTPSDPNLPSDQAINEGWYRLNAEYDPTHPNGTGSLHQLVFPASQVSWDADEGRYVSTGTPVQSTILDVAGTTRLYTNSIVPAQTTNPTIPQVGPEHILLQSATNDPEDFFVFYVIIGNAIDVNLVAEIPVDQYELTGGGIWADKAGFGELDISDVSFTDLTVTGTLDVTGAAVTGMISDNVTYTTDGNTVTQELNDLNNQVQAVFTQLDGFMSTDNLGTDKLVVEEVEPQFETNGVSLNMTSADFTTQGTRVEKNGQFTQNKEQPYLLSTGVYTDPDQWTETITVSPALKLAHSAFESTQDGSITMPDGKGMLDSTQQNTITKTDNLITIGQANDTDEIQINGSLSAWYGPKPTDGTTGNRIPDEQRAIELAGQVFGNGIPRGQYTFFNEGQTLALAQSQVEAVDLTPLTLDPNFPVNAIVWGEDDGNIWEGVATMPIQYRAIGATIGNAGTNYAIGDQVEDANGTALTVTSIQDQASNTYNATSVSVVSSGNGFVVGDTVTDASGTTATVNLIDEQQVTQYRANGATVTQGGNGYAVGDQVQDTNGTQATVAAISEVLQTQFRANSVTLISVGDFNASVGQIINDPADSATTYEVQSVIERFWSANGSINFVGSLRNANATFNYSIDSNTGNSQDSMLLTLTNNDGAKQWGSNVQPNITYGGSGYAIGDRVNLTGNTSILYAGVGIVTSVDQDGAVTAINFTNALPFFSSDVSGTNLSTNATTGTGSGLLLQYPSGSLNQDYYWYADYNTTINVTRQMFATESTWTQWPAPQSGVPNIFFWGLNSFNAVQNLTIAANPWGSINQAGNKTIASTGPLALPLQFQVSSQVQTIGTGVGPATVINVTTNPWVPNNFAGIRSLTTITGSGAGLQVIFNISNQTIGIGSGRVLTLNLVNTPQVSTNFAGVNRLLTGGSGTNLIVQFTTQTNIIPSGLGSVTGVLIGYNPWVNFNFNTGWRPQTTTSGIGTGLTIQFTTQQQDTGANPSWTWNQITPPDWNSGDFIKAHYFLQYAQGSEWQSGIAYWLGNAEGFFENTIGNVGIGTDGLNIELNTLNALTLTKTAVGSQVDDGRGVLRSTTAAGIGYDDNSNETVKDKLDESLNKTGDTLEGIIEFDEDAGLSIAGATSAVTIEEDPEAITDLIVNTNGNRITGVSNPINNLDVVNLQTLNSFIPEDNTFITVPDYANGGMSMTDPTVRVNDVMQQSGWVNAGAANGTGYVTINGVTYMVAGSGASWASTGSIFRVSKDDIITSSLPNGGWTFIPSKYVWATAPATRLHLNYIGPPDYANAETTNRITSWGGGAPNPTNTWVVDRDGYVLVGGNWTSGDAGIAVMINGTRLSNIRNGSNGMSPSSMIFQVSKGDSVTVPTAFNVSPAYVYYVPPTTVPPMFVTGADLQSSTAAGQVAINSVDRTMSVNGFLPDWSNVISLTQPTLTVAGLNGYTYTISSNEEGYLCATIRVVAGNFGLAINGVRVTYVTSSNTSFFSNTSIFVPVKEGDVITFTNAYLGTGGAFYFDDYKIVKTI